MRKINQAKKLLYYKKVQQGLVIAITVFFIFSMFIVAPWATDGYQDINSKAELEQRIASALTNGETEILIDYDGEDWQNMKSWLKENFRYPVLSQYTDEFTIYNYDGADFTYWSYSNKKRVKIIVSYKQNKEQIAEIYTYADNFIRDNKLQSMSAYDQIATVHDWLVNNFTYNINSDKVYLMLQDGQANCYGYTMMNYIILNQLGINIRTTSGKMNNSHIWNVIELDGNWYYEDVTWDTVDKGRDYFLISTDKLTQTHTIEGNFIVDCPTTYSSNTSNNTSVITDNTTLNEETNISEEIIIVENKDTQQSEFVEDNTSTNEIFPSETRDESVVKEIPSDSTDIPIMESVIPEPNQIDKLKKLTNLLKKLKAMKGN